jgi:hypothetical protein
MAIQVFKNAYVRIGTSAAPSTSHWTLVRSVTLNYKQEILDKTAMGSSGRRRTYGLRDASLSVEFNQEYSTAWKGGTVKSMDGLLYGLMGVASSNCFISVRATTGAVGASNPQYNGRYLLESYNPVSGGVADLGVVTASFSADGLISRLTA